MSLLDYDPYRLTILQKHLLGMATKDGEKGRDFAVVLAGDALIHLTNEHCEYHGG